MAEKVLANYDPLADVLYLSVGTPNERARSYEDDKGLIWRKSPEGDWVGVTIPDYKYCWTDREAELARLLSARLPQTVGQALHAH